MTGSARFELEKFNGTWDFGLWRESLKGIIVHQKVAKALKPKEELTDKLQKEELEDMEELAYYTIIMYLSNTVRRKVQNMKTARELWSKLEEIYMKPSLTNKINLLESLYGFKMSSHLSLDDNLDVFNQIIIGLANLKHTVDEESQAVILLRSLPPAYQKLKSVIKYWRDTLTLDDVLGALKSKEQEMSKEKDNVKDEAYLARGRDNNRGRDHYRKDHFKGNHRSQSRSKSRGKYHKDRKCYFCGKVGHIKRFCIEFKNNFKEDREKKHDSASNVEESDRCSSDGD
jgi:hypothetical protein